MTAHTVRLSLAIVIITALILTISPKVIGVGIQSSAIDNILNLIPPEAEYEFEIQQQSLQSGWFESESSLELIYTPIGADTITLVFDLEIDHGPVLMTNKGPRLGLAYASITPHIRNEVFELAIADFPFELPPVSMDLMAGFDQSLLIGIEIAPVDYSGENGELNFGGVNGSFTSASDQSAEFIMTMDQLQANESSARFSFDMSGLEISTQTERVSDILAPSNARFSIPSFESSSPFPISVEDFSSNTSLSKAENDDLNFRQSINIEKIASDLPVNSFNWELEFQQLDPQVIALYYDLLAQLQLELANNSNTTTPAVNQIGRELAVLAAQNPLTIKNYLHTDAYGGEHRAQLEVNWQGLPDLDNIARMDINEAIAALAFDIDITLDLQAVMSSPAAQLLDSYVQQGFLQLDNGRILVKASLKEGVLIINGEESKISF